MRGAAAVARLCPSGGRCRPVGAAADDAAAGAALAAALFSRRGGQARAYLGPGGVRPPLSARPRGRGTSPQRVGWGRHPWRRGRCTSFWLASAPFCGSRAVGGGNQGCRG